MISAAPFLYFPVNFQHLCVPFSGHNLHLKILFLIINKTDFAASQYGWIGNCWINCKQINTVSVEDKMRLHCGYILTQYAQQHWIGYWWLHSVIQIITCNINTFNIIALFNYTQFASVILNHQLQFKNCTVILQKRLLD